MDTLRKKIKLDEECQSAKETGQEKENEKFAFTSSKNVKEEQKENKCPPTLSSAVNYENKCSPTLSSVVNRENKCPPTLSSAINYENKCSPTLSSAVNYENKCSPTLSSVVNRENKCPPTLSSVVNRENKCPRTLSSVINSENKCPRTLSSVVDSENKCPPTLSSIVNNENNCPSKSSVNTEQQNTVDKICRDNEEEKKCSFTQTSFMPKSHHSMCQEKDPTTNAPIVFDEEKYSSMKLMDQLDYISYMLIKRNECDIIMKPKRKKIVSNYRGGVITKLTKESFVRSYCNFQLNGVWSPATKSIHRDILIQEISAMQPRFKDICFSQPCSALSWHPTDGQLLAVASKNGEILMCRALADINYIQMITGIGPGGSINAMQISKNRPGHLYVASKEGFVNILDYEKQVSTQLLKIKNSRHWYTSLCVDEENNVLVVGDTTGIVTFVDTRSHKVIKEEFCHRGKVIHVEINKKDPKLLATSSNDHLVLLWDCRKKLGEMSSIVACLRHQSTVRSSYFSLTDGNRLLTTSQDKSELRVYSAPFWKVERTIVHPHRQLPQVTPIRANWHPLEDIIVVGRYPDPEVLTYDQKLRCVDFIDAASGTLLYELANKKVSTISSINQFNCSGDILASTSGAKLILWSNKF